MSHLKIQFDGDRMSFLPGEEIAGEMSWTVEGGIDAVELRLFWFTRGKGTEDAEVVQTVRIENPLGTDTRHFRLALPRVPYSFSGRLISLIWAVELVALPSKEGVRTEIVMGPGGEEIYLLEDDPPSSGVKTWFKRTS